MKTSSSPRLSPLLLFLLVLALFLHPISSTRAAKPGKPGKPGKNQPTPAPTPAPASTPASPASTAAPDAATVKAALLNTTKQHLDALLDSTGKVKELKGKSAGAAEALAFYLTFEVTHDARYRAAALALADLELQDMRATKFGVRAIKEKEKEGGTKIMGGGPPPFGFYTANVGYILHQEGGRTEDLKYIATVLDQYPWSDEGWWSSDIDIVTGESKVPMTKPSIINKNACVAMAAGTLSAFIKDLDPALAARLKQKTDKFLYEKLIPAQEADGFWHYSLSSNDPKDKDILGYFMLTTRALMTLQHFNPAYREPKLNAALEKAQSFAAKHIAPMTDPNAGAEGTPHMTVSTPKHYTLADEPKRGFDLSLILIASGHEAEGLPILNATLPHFPIGNAGQDGGHAAEPGALLLKWWK